MTNTVTRVQTIMDANAQIRASLETGVKLEGGSGLMELWDFLQLKCASYINSDLPGLGQAFTQPPGKPLRCDSHTLRVELLDSLNSLSFKKTGLNWKMNVCIELNW